ncbi:MAG: recombinase RecA [Thermoprotei archaeon]|nr:MAG: recombinase RecA [Thermoprotei archaeon]RLF01724.1 MAG: recombinase RecA [Thermoprotei archaeon]
MGSCGRLRKTIYSPLSPPCGGKFFSPASSSSQSLASNPSPVAVPTTERSVAQYTPSITISPRLDLTPTGIPLLDDHILRGGFLRGKTYLIAGETGCGKTIFSLQFLINGVLKFNESGIYLAIDEPAAHVVKGLTLFGWDVKELIERRKLLFLDMRTHFRRLYLKEKDRRIDPRIVIGNIIKYIEKINAKRLVIDPIAPLMYGGSEEDVLYAREFLREMVFELEKLGDVTTIMTSEIPTGSSRLSRFGVEEFLATGIIVLGLEEINGKIYRVMYIRKARWAPVKPAKYVFDIVAGRGVIIRGPLSEILKKESEMGFD